LADKDYNWNFRSNARAAQTSALQINRLNDAVEDLNKGTKQTEKSTKSLFMRLTTGAAIWNIWNRAVDVASKRIKQLTGIFTNLIKSVRDVGGSFESAAAQIRGLLSEGADVAIEKAKELGATTMYTATQAASGLIELARAGFTGKEAAEALAPVLAAAQANAISLGAASRIGAVGMNQFRASGEGVKDILEILTAAAKESPTTILALGSAMKNAAPMASLLGMNATKTAAMLAMMAKSGLTAGRSGTMLRTSLERLAKTTPAGDKALTKLGITLKRLDLSQPTQWIEIFRKALTKIPEASDQVALLKPIFGRAVTGILPIIQQGGAAFTEMEEKIIRSRQAMEEIKNLMATTLVAAYNRLKSAIESVYVNLVDVIGIPIKSYYNTLATIVGKFSNRIKEVGKAFKGQATDLESWIALVKKQGFRGMFQGLIAELKPELDKLKQLFTATWEGIKALSVEFFNSAFPKGIDPALNKAGEYAGKIIVKAMIAAIKYAVNTIGNVAGEVIEAAFATATGAAEGAITAAFEAAEGIPEAIQNYIDYPGQQKQIDELVKHLDKMLAKKHEIEKAGIISDEDIVRLGNIDKQIKQSVAELKKLGAEVSLPRPTPSRPMNRGEREDILEDEQAPYVSPADLKLQAYAEQQRQRKRQYDQRLKAMVEKEAAAEGISPEEAEKRVMRRRRRRAILASYKRQQALAESPEALEARKGELEAQMGLLDQQKQYKQALEQSKNVILETKLALIETGKEFAKWLLEPVDKFRRAFADVRQKWGETVQAIKSKSLEIGKRFGLVNEGAAKKEEVSIAKESLGITEKRLREAQTPEMRMKLRERQAEQLATLSELTGEKGYARQAQQALQTSQRDALQQEKIEMQKVALDLKATKESIPLLQKMLSQSETEAGKSAILEKLQTQLMDLGKVTQASTITKDLMVAQMKSAEESAQYLKLSAERLGTLIKLVPLMERLVQNSDDAGGAPPYDPEMQAP
jgi:TP901 family phage tail tape measure protein